MNTVIELENVSKKYQDGFAIQPTNISIKEGYITGFIGENGAGKTTIIKLMLQIVKADTGIVRIFGEDTHTSGAKIKEDIGIVLDGMFFPESLHPMDIQGIMKHMYKQWDGSLYIDYLERFHIPKKLHIKKFSKGMKKKLEIVTALSHRPKLLLLDEPTSGLDPVVRNEILDIFMEFIQEEDHSIFLSTHIISDLDHIADDVILIDHGEILLQDTRDEIISNYGILKCDPEDIMQIDRKDILAITHTPYYDEILVNDRFYCMNKYPNHIIDQVDLESFMVMMIKGGKQ